MQCISESCDGLTTRVTETNNTLAAVYRRRRCPSCGASYVSIEVMSPVQSIPESIRKSKQQECHE